MSRFHELLFRLEPFFQRRKIDAELSDELQVHLEMAAEANIASGMDPAAARVAAEREFGRLESIKQDYRDERGISWVEHLIQDLTFGARMLRRSPVFTTVAVATLALGIGVNSALFSALNALLLRAPLVDQPERLVGLFRRTPADDSYNRISYLDYEALRDRSRSFSGLAAYYFTPVHFSARGMTSRVWGQLVTPNYFSVLGVRLAMGHGFTKPSEPRAAPLEAILSHEFWQRQCESDAGIVGQTIVLNGHSFVVVGVAPPGFRDLEPWLVPDVWVPLGTQPRIMPGGDWLEVSGYSWLRVVARLAPGIDLSQAQTEASDLAATIGRERGPTSSLTHVAVVSDVGLHPELRPMIRGYLGILMAAAVVVLLIVCVNLATLWLARSMTRWKEMGTRLALGATRPRLFRQMLTESMMVAVTGGLLALLITPLLLHAIERLQSLSSVPAPVEFRLDYRGFLFSGAVSLLTGVVMGSLPAWTAAQTKILSVMKHGSPYQHARPSAWRSSLVALQIAASVVLLVCAGLFIRSLQHTRQIDLGFGTERVCIVSFDLGLQGFSPSEGGRFHEEVKRAVGALAGVESVGLADSPPLNPRVEDTRVWFESPNHPVNSDGMMVHFAVVDSDYFAALGLPFARGRGFSATEEQGAEPVAVVNETFARIIEPKGDVLSRAVRLSPGGPAHRIIGVARDSKYVTLGEASRPFLYLPLAHNSRATATLVVRAAADPESLIGPITRAVQGLDRGLPIYRAMSLQSHVASQHFVPQWAAVLLGVFAGLAFFLALLGVVGVTAYDVMQRTREFGVRIAFGATPGNILRLILKKELKPLAFGILVGTGAALVAARFVGGFLYRVGAVDASKLFLVGVLVVVAALLAALLPGWRATAIAPTEALRHE